MRTLYLMRHAKSRWDEYVSDTERGLKKRGKREARQLGRGLAEQEPLPDLVMSSPARRARKTATRVAKLWGYEGRVLQHHLLYEGGLEDCLQIVRALDDVVESVLLVGHNPTLEELLLVLTGTVTPLPTATVVRVDLPIDAWVALEFPSNGQLVFMMRGKDLETA